jgi:hypothetical protein
MTDQKKRRQMNRQACKAEMEKDKKRKISEWQITTSQCAFWAFWWEKNHQVFSSRHQSPKHLTG